MATLRRAEPVRRHGRRARQPRRALSPGYAVPVAARTAAQRRPATAVQLARRPRTTRCCRSIWPIPKHRQRRQRSASRADLSRTGASSSGRAAYYELLLVRNFDLRPQSSRSSLRFAADFADVFEVRGQKRRAARHSARPSGFRRYGGVALSRAGRHRARHDACGSSPPRAARHRSAPHSSCSSGRGEWRAALRSGVRSRSAGKRRLERAAAITARCARAGERRASERPARAASTARTRSSTSWPRRSRRRSLHADHRTPSTGPTRLPASPGSARRSAATASSPRC